MKKGYIVVMYHAPPTPTFGDYAALAGPAIEAAGGRFIARGQPVKVYENGRMDRVTVVEFDSVEKAIAARESAGYRAAMEKLGTIARDVRIVEGV